MEFMYLVFTRMSGDSYRRRLRSLLYLCYVFRALINSPGITQHDCGKIKTKRVNHIILIALIQYNTTLLSPCREICFLARHYIKTFNTVNNKTSTTQ